MAVGPTVYRSRTYFAGLGRLALNLMFIQIWLFGIYLCGFESELFRNGSALWFMMAVSIIALRVQATANQGTEAR